LKEIQYLSSIMRKIITSLFIILCLSSVYAEWLNFDRSFATNKLKNSDLEGWTIKGHEKGSKKIT